MTARHCRITTRGPSWGRSKSRRNHLLQVLSGHLDIDAIGSIDSDHRMAAVALMREGLLAAAHAEQEGYQGEAY